MLLAASCAVAGHQVELFPSTFWLMPSICMLPSIDCMYERAGIQAPNLRQGSHYANLCRDGNNWSYAYCRRQWSLIDKPDLRYQQLNSWDADMMHLDAQFSFMGSSHQLVSHAGSEEKPPKQVCICHIGAWTACC